eukprot:3533910-Prymnesium_polylepis.1
MRTRMRIVTLEPRILASSRLIMPPAAYLSPQCRLWARTTRPASRCSSCSSSRPKGPDNYAALPRDDRRSRRRRGRHSLGYRRHQIVPVI